MCRIQGGELFERVIEEDYTLTEKACTVFIRQICEGVDFLHSRDILHLGKLSNFNTLSDLEFNDFSDNQKLLLFRLNRSQARKCTVFIT